MTTRNDVSIDYSQSPRVAVVAAPSAEYTMQDLVDTERVIESSFQGMSYSKLLNASGKEDLGGGVKVGITVAHQDTLIAFEGRFTPAETSTITSASGTPVLGSVLLTDTTALFITNNVKRGSAYINFDDRSVGDVVEVISETVLRVTTPVNGDNNNFEVGDRYDVYNIIQCNATGGNLTAVDTVPATINAILPTWCTQIVLTSSSSATLSEQADIQFASFNGAVTVDLANETGNAVSGTTFPAGTERSPSNNFADAVTIAIDRGFRAFRVIGDALLDTGIDFTDFRFFGQGQNLSTLTLDPAALFVNCSYFDATITGTLDGDCHIEDCIIESLTFVSGVIENCILADGTITLGGSSTAHFINCASGVPGVATPIIDMGGSGQDLALRNYNGGIELRNKTGSDKVSIDLNSGQIILHSTVAVTAGDVVLRGVGKLTDNSTGVAPINELVDGAQLQVMAKIMRNRMETDPVTGVMTVFDDDDVTPLLTGNIYEDVLAAQIYRGRGMERRDRLT